MILEKSKKKIVSFFTSKVIFCLFCFYCCSVIVLCALVFGCGVGMGWDARGEGKVGGGGGAGRETRVKLMRVTGNRNKTKLSFGETYFRKTEVATHC